MARRVLQSLHRVASHDLCFLSALLAMRALVRPYAGLYHDARLYALQVLNQAQDGFFSNDLFLAFGSQDSYSAFSLLMAPVAQLVGVSMAFFLGYLLSLGLLLWAEIRLFRVLIPDKAIASLALILLAVTDVPYAGLNIFHAHETFLTARLPAQACVMAGLACLIHGQTARAWGWSLFGMALHPLMGVGGICVVLAVTIAPFLTPQRIAAILGALLLAFIPVGSLAAKLNLTTIDGMWLADLRLISAHCFLSEWLASDWIRLCGSVLIAVAACRWLAPHARNMVVSVVVLAAGSVLVNGIAESTGNAFLLQGQAYRGLWLLQVFTFPLALLMARRTWQSPSAVSRALSLIIVSFVGGVLAQFGSHPSHIFVAAVVLATCGCVAYFVQRGVPASTRDRRWTAAVHGLLGGSIVFSVIGLWQLCQIAPQIPEGPLRFVWFAPRQCCNLAMIIIGLLVLHGMWSLAQTRARFTRLAILSAMTLSLLAYVIDAHPAYRARYVYGHRDLQFVKQAIARPNRDRATQVFWPIDAAHIWVGLTASSYADFLQVQGAVFSPDTTAEGRRRANLTRSFKVASMRQRTQYAPYWKRELLYLGTTMQQQHPQAPDLIRLAMDRQLDWVVLGYGIKGIPSKTNGSVHVYDCRQIRQRATLQ